MKQPPDKLSQLSHLYLETARALDLKSEIVDPESNYFRIYNCSKELTIFRGIPSCNDFVCTEFHNPTDRYLQLIRHLGIRTYNWTWFDLNSATDKSYLKLINQIKRRLPAVLTTPDDQYTWVVETESLIEIVTELYNVQPNRIGIQPFYEKRYQALMLGENILDLISIKPLSVIGNGKDTISDLIEKNENKLTTNQLLAQLPRISQTFLEQVPSDGQLVYLESPATGFRGRSKRIDLNTLTNQDKSFFNKSSIASRLRLGILNVVKNRKGQWCVQSIKSPTNLQPFIHADTPNADYPIKRILESYFLSDITTHSNFFRPRLTVKITQNLSVIPSIITDFIDASKRLGLSTQPYINGKLLRIENQSDILEMSIWRSAYPHFSCNNKASVVRYKDITTRILEKYALPVPKHKLFTISHLSDDLPFILEYARKHYPVVVKPRAGTLSKGVTTAIMDDERCQAAIDEALKHDNNILIEEHLKSSSQPTLGGEFRVHVMQDQVIQVINRIPAYVTGDGVQDIRTLIEQRKNNLNPRVPTLTSTLSTDKDSQTDLALKIQNKSFDTIPSKGEIIRVMIFCGEYHSGEAVDYPIDLIHPDTIDMFIRASRVLGLTWSGIDFISPDITRSYKEVRCGINEVNNRPNIKLVMKLCPDFPSRMLKAYFAL